MKTPTHCPLCGDKMIYTSGDGAWDNTYYCNAPFHKNFEFMCEVSWGISTTKYIQLLDIDSNLKLRWTCEQYGDIDPNTITIGVEYSPYKNKKINWEYQHPLMDKFKELVRKLETREVFS